MLRAARRIVFVVLIAIAMSLAMANLWAPIPASAQSTYSLSPRFFDSTGNPLVGVTITLYLHGTPHTAPNVIATGVTDTNGYMQPPFTATSGASYDFVTSSPLVPAGTFTAQPGVLITLVPGPPGPAGSPGANGAQGPPGSPAARPTCGDPNCSWAYSTSVNTLYVVTPSPLPSPTCANGNCSWGGLNGLTLTVGSPSPLPSPTCANPNCTWGGTYGLTLDVETPTPLPSPTCANANCTWGGANGLTLDVETPSPAPSMPCPTPSAGIDITGTYMPNCSFSLISSGSGFSVQMDYSPSLNSSFSQTQSTTLPGSAGDTYNLYASVGADTSSGNNLTLIGTGASTGNWNAGVSAGSGYKIIEIYGTAPGGTAISVTCADSGVNGTSYPTDCHVLATKQ